MKYTIKRKQAQYVLQKIHEKGNESLYPAVLVAVDVFFEDRVFATGGFFPEFCDAQNYCDALIEKRMKLQKDGKVIPFAVYLNGNLYKQKWDDTEFTDEDYTPPTNR